jgi:hypothetical protein
LLLALVDEWYYCVGMRKIVVAAVVLGALLAGCSSEPPAGKGHATWKDTLPEWVEMTGADCGAVLPDGTTDPKAMCAIGEALFVGP